MKVYASGLFILIFAMFALGSNFALSAEHPGTAVGEQKSTVEHPGKATKAITADFVKKSIKQHAEDQAKAKGGVFVIHDDKLNKDWRLKLVQVHDPVRTFEKGGQTIYFACSDFKADDSKDLLDIDFWMVSKANKLEVIDTKIHKVNGEPRYGYEGIDIKTVQ
jgi:hypothetical protein